MTGPQHADARDPDQRRTEEQDRAVGSGHGEVLGHHLAEHDVQVHDDRERDDENEIGCSEASR